MPSAPAYALHLVEPPHRQVERAAVVLEVQEVDGDLLVARAQRQLREPFVDADAVQLVDDEVARHEVLEVALDERALRLLRRAPRRLLAEISCSDRDRHAVERQLEAVPERAEHDLDVDALCGRIKDVVRLHHAVQVRNDLVALEQRLEPLGVLQVGHGDERAHAFVAPIAEALGQRPQQLLVLLGARALQLDRQIAMLVDGEANHGNRAGRRRSRADAPRRADRDRTRRRSSSVPMKKSSGGKASRCSSSRI